MPTIRVILDRTLLDAVDEAARRLHVWRSGLVRDALRGHLARLRLREIEELEERDRAGYFRVPVTTEEAGAWEAAACWPDD